MRRTMILGKLALCAAVLGLAGSPAWADAVELRIATLAPAGSPFMDLRARAAGEVKDKTAGRVSLAYLEGGKEGDERDLVRNLVRGQLAGAELTAVGLAMIDESIRVLELPMMFASVEELDYVADKMWPYFQAKFEKKGFKLIDRGEVGWVYFLSRTKVEKLDDLKGQKLCLWGDDPLVRAAFKALGLSGVPIDVPSVDAALSGGKLDACYASPLGALVLQWYTKVTYMTSMPISFGIGATVVSLDALKPVSADDVKIIEDTSKAYAKKLRKVLRKANQDAKGVMTRKGVTVVQTPVETVDAFTKQSTEAWTELVGKIFSKEELTMVLQYRDEYRAKPKP